MATYTPHYPPEQNHTYVQSTSEYNADTLRNYRSTDPTLSKIGSSLVGTQWHSANGKGETPGRFHIDLGDAYVIKRVYYENAHNSGGTTIYGVEHLAAIQGSNSSSDFNDLVYTNDGTWANITNDSGGHMVRHVNVNIEDPQYILLTNSTAYRYWAFKFVDNFGDPAYMAIRHIELQTEDAGGVAVPATGFMRTNSKFWS